MGSFSYMMGYKSPLDKDYMYIAVSSYTEIYYGTCVYMYYNQLGLLVCCNKPWKTIGNLGGGQLSARGEVKGFFFCRVSLS